jgi:hypothetical protein
MFPIGKIAQILFSAGLPRREVVAAGAVAPGPAYVQASGEAATAAMTLADADEFGQLMIFEATDVSNTVDLDFNIPSGAVTWTASNVGDTLILLSSASGKWTILAGTAS